MPLPGFPLPSWSCTFFSVYCYLPDTVLVLPHQFHYFPKILATCLLLSHIFPMDFTDTFPVLYWDFSGSFLFYSLYIPAYCHTKILVLSRYLHSTFTEIFQYFCSTCLIVFSGISSYFFPIIPNSGTFLVIFYYFPGN